MTTPSLTTKTMQNIPLVVFMLLLVDSLHLVFARALRDYFPPIISAFLVLAIATLEIALYMAIRRQIRWQLLRQHLGFFATIGFLVAAATVLSYTAVQYIDPGTASLLARIVTVFSLGFGFFWLKERLTGQQWLGTITCLVGVAIISFQPGDYWRVGSLFILGSTFFYALHAAVVKRYGQTIEFNNFFLFRVGTTAVFLLFFVISNGQLSYGVQPIGWLIVLITATVDVVISRILYYLVLRRLSMSLHAIILTLSPVITILWSWLFFREVPTGQGLLGGTAVLIGITVVTLRRRNRPHV